MLDKLWQKAKKVATIVSEDGFSSPENMRKLIIKNLMLLDELHLDAAGNGLQKWTDKHDIEACFRLQKWADEHDIEDGDIPRDLSALCDLECLSFENFSYFEREKISSLPEDICKLTNLKVLVLGSATHPEIILNNLTKLPKGIGNLAELTDIYLQFNSLSELPAEIGNLRKLKTLKLGGNNLSFLPKNIGNLKELEILTIWNNQLKELPEELCLLTNLKGLDISMNSLSILPDYIIRLTGLKAFYYQNDNLKLNGSQKAWIKTLKSNGCELFPEEIDEIPELKDHDMKPPEQFDLF